MLIALMNGQMSIPVAILIVIAIIIALTIRQYGQAMTAYMFGDNTGRNAGHLTINPMVHVDLMGLVMIMLIGFGYGKPVPVEPRNFKKHYMLPVVALAGPLVNLILAILAANFWAFGLQSGIDALVGPGQSVFFSTFVYINLLLFLFNLLPIGSLDGSKILEYLLPYPLNRKYRELNDSYGNYLLLALVVISLLGFPFFRILSNLAQQIIPYIQFIN